MIRLVASLWLFVCCATAVLAEPVVLSPHQYRDRSSPDYYPNTGKDNPAYRGDTSPQQAAYYRVQPGDSIERIARQIGVNANDIIRWNQLNPIYTLKVGQNLCISSVCSKERRKRSSTPDYYEVRKGDYLGLIAKRLHVTERLLITRNHLSAPYPLIPGQRLCVRSKSCLSADGEETPVPRKGEEYHYHVKRGDTLSRIAAQYNVSIQQLMKWNHLSSADHIIAGQRLLMYPNDAIRPQDSEAGSVNTPNREYVVARYETLDYLSNRFEMTQEKIIELNHLKKPYKLEEGQVLCLDNPAPCHSTVHIVAHNETLELVAQLYNISTDELIRLNMLESPYQLYPNQRLCLNKIYPCRGANRINPIDPEWIPQFEWPLSNDHEIITPFGRIGGRMHDGIDIRAIKGTPVYAAADGKIVFGGDRLDNNAKKTSTYGKMVIIEHPNHVFTIYAHNSSIARWSGYVNQGDVIAYSGDSGQSEVPNLHFEIRRGKTPVNPLDYLPQRSTSIHYEH